MAVTLHDTAHFPNVARPRRGFDCYECGKPNGRVEGRDHKWWTFDGEGYPIDLCRTCFERQMRAIARV